MYKPRQKIRTFALSGPCLPTSSDGSPLLELSGISGEEQLSQIYQYVLQVRTASAAELTTDEAANLNLLELVGQEVTVTVQLDGMGTFVPGMPGRRGASNIGQGTREISGIITEASFVGQPARASSAWAAITRCSSRKATRCPICPATRASIPSVSSGSSWASKVSPATAK